MPSTVTPGRVTVTPPAAEVARAAARAAPGTAARLSAAARAAPATSPGRVFRPTPLVRTVSPAFSASSITGRRVTMSHKMPRDKTRGRTENGIVGRRSLPAEEGDQRATERLLGVGGQ